MPLAKSYSICSGPVPATCGRQAWGQPSIHSTVVRKVSRPRGENACVSPTGRTPSRVMPVPPSGSSKRSACPVFCTGDPIAVPQGWCPDTSRRGYVRELDLFLTRGHVADKPPAFQGHAVIDGKRGKVLEGGRDNLVAVRRSDDARIRVEAGKDGVGVHRVGVS